MTEKILLLYSAMRDKRTPWYAKALCWFTLAYIISPIDLIPDFIPVIGLLDEVILIPIALWCIFKLIPVSVKEQASIDINKEYQSKLYVYGIILVISLWFICIYTTYKFLFN